MLLDKIQTLVNDGAEALGQKIPIPPITGDTIARRRSSLSELEMTNRASIQHHTGWAEAYGLCSSVGVVDSLTYYELCRELAGNYDLLLSVVLAMKMKVMTEPARMYVLNGGPQPLLHVGKSTPTLLRVAHEGAQSGLWDMEDVFTLPAPMTPVSPDILEHFDVDGFDGSEVYLA